MKFLFLIVIVISVVSSDNARPRRQVQNCGNSNCNQNNGGGLGFGPFGFGGVPLGFVPFGISASQNCFNSNCNQNNFGRKKREIIRSRNRRSENDDCSGVQLCLPSLMPIEKYFNCCILPGLQNQKCQHRFSHLLPKTFPKICATSVQIFALYYELKKKYFHPTFI